MSLLRQRRGLTLIEVMVALAVLSIIAILTFSTFSSSIKARDVLSENDQVQQSARVALSKITREMELAYLTYNKQVPNTYRTVFVSVDDEPIDSLWFATLSHQRLYRNSREADQAEVTIWGEEAADGSMTLMHRESGIIDHEPGKDGVVYPLAYGVKRFTVRYLDPETCDWEDEWNSTQAEQLDRLPRAAQIVLVLLGPDPDDDKAKVEKTFATTIIFEYGKRVQCSVFNGTEGDQEVTEEL